MISPRAASFSSAASATPVCGHVNRPLRSARAEASASSASVAISTTPSNARSARTAFLKLTGLPIWIAEASVVLRLDRLERRPSRRDSSRTAGSRARPARRRSAAARSTSPSASSISKPAPSADTLPRLPPGITTQSGTCQPSCCASSIATVFWPSSAQRVHRVREVHALALGELLHEPHAAVEVGVDREHERAHRERLHELRRRDLAARQDHDRADPGGRRVRRERRRGVAGRRARDRADRLAVARSSA